MWPFGKEKKQERSKLKDKTIFKTRCMEVDNCLSQVMLKDNISRSEVFYYRDKIVASLDEAVNFAPDAKTKDECLSLAIKIKTYDWRYFQTEANYLRKKVEQWLQYPEKQQFTSTELDKNHANVIGKGKDSPNIIKHETIHDKSKIREYSLSQLSAPIFMNIPSSSDDDELFKQAYSLMQNKRWGEARKIIQDGMQICKRKDRLCELIANIYHIEQNSLAIGWYMQSCVLGSPSWVPYLMVSYAARALGLDDIAWRCLNACDVIETGMKRIDKLETEIANLVRYSDQSQLVSAMKNFEKVMDSCLPLSNELPHDQKERSIFLLQNVTGDTEIPPESLRTRLLRRRG